jgi:endonuclease/exonuclease/phosphatase family metal-dependent hydrolase
VGCGPVWTRPRKTFIGRLPTARIDDIFIDTGLPVTGIEVSRSELVQVASDHLPLIAELRIPKQVLGSRVSMADPESVHSRH